MRSETRTLTILTLAPGMPIALVDDILTATERSLLELGATQVWVDGSQPGLTVMAELPVAVLAAVAEEPAPAPRPRGTGPAQTSSRQAR